MRKLLMATAAMVGASLGMANAAQLLTQSPTGLTATTQGTNMPIIAPSAPSPSVPGPGQIVVHLDMRENVYIVGSWGSLDSVNGNKQQPVSILGYPRLYMGVDAQATNGLKYGLAWEIRNVGPAGYTSSNGNPGISGGSTGEQLFWRRDYLYLGTAQLGTVRAGQTDGPMSLLLIGTFDDFATGLFNGDINDAGVGAGSVASGVVPLWPFPDVGNEYTSAKVVYLSPAFAGFDFSASFEPSSANLTDSSNCNTLSSPAFAAGPINCNGQSASNSANDLQRRRNTLEAGIRYRGAFSGVGLAGSLITMQGGNVGAGPFNPGIPNPSNPSHPITQFEHLSMYDGGAAITYLGATVGGNVIWGAYNGQFAPKPDGGANSIAWIAGAEYTYGPLIVGGAYFRWKYQGLPGLPTQRTDQGIQFGFTYNIAPGLALLGEYLYGQRYQGDFNFATGTAGTAFNNVKMQIAGIGFQFRW